MNSQQARALVQETFPQTFDKGRFQQFTINLLNHIDEGKAAQWNSTYVKDAFKEHVQRFERLGTYTSPDNEKCDVLIVHLTTESKLERARTAIRNFVADHLKTRDSKEAALVAFVSPSEKSWRFSYIKMEYAAVEKEDGKIGMQTNLTPARRSSYIVGENESCHTAQSRFLNLLLDTENNPTLAQLEDAFSVEAVTKEFFEQYKALFLDLNDELDDLAKKDKTIREEFAEKNVSTNDFAKKLMGQIVFLYFLQKKGWLGVPRGADWGDGAHNFLRQLFDGKFGSFKNFFNDILEPLFYDTLATDRGHDAWCNIFKCRIPFLNGGLFEPLCDYDWQRTDITIPNALFSNTKKNDAGDTGTGILDVFDRYNFTVNEAEPLEKEVAIDPEMLGKVFENLLEVKERKSKGSFYTPREIVHYMCQESLINYLDTAINSKTETVGRENRKQALLGSEKAEQTLLTVPTREETIPRADLETFIHSGDQASYYEAARVEKEVGRGRKLPKTIETHAKILDDKLANIAVCDPAIGSGAFPVGMMQEIVRARSALTPYFNDPHERNAYHFKRHAIQSCLYGVDIDPGAVEIAKLRLWLSLVVDEEDVKQIKPLPNLDYKIVSGNSLLGVEKNLFNQELFKQLEDLKPKFFDESHRKEKEAYKRQIDKTIHELTNGKEDFDFEIYFSEVFHRKKGFDVTIGNPPYITYHGRRRELISNAELQSLKSNYACAFDKERDGKYNSAMFFIEKLVKLCGQRGTACCITDISFYEHFYMGVKRFLIENTKILNLVNGLTSFENVASGQLILITSRAANKDEALNNVVTVNAHGLWSDEIRINQRDWCKPEKRYQFYTPESGLDGLFSKVEGQHKPLEFYFPNKLIRTGESVGVKEQGFVIEKATSGSTVPIYEYLEGGKSIPERYATPRPTRYFRFDTDLLNKKNEAYRRDAIKSKRKNPKVLGIGDKLAFDNPKILIRQSCDHVCCTFTSKPYVYNRSYYSISNTNSSGQSETNLFYVLAILNSKLITFYARKKRVIRMEHGKQPQIRLEDVKALPIKMPSAQEQRPLVKLVDRILAAKAKDAEEDTSKLEREIDELVYALYGLTPEEIKIVEGAAK